jgi:hypothetical protein
MTTGVLIHPVRDSAPILFVVSIFESKGTVKITPASSELSITFGTFKILLHQPFLLYKRFQIGLLRCVQVGTHKVKCSIIGLFYLHFHCLLRFEK